MLLSQASYGIHAYDMYPADRLIRWNCIAVWNIFFLDTRRVNNYNEEVRDVGHISLTYVYSWNVVQ